MARDPGLEELINDELADLTGVTQKAMFGGLAWLANGNLLCGARKDSLLVRLGKGNDAWALKISGVIPMIMGKAGCTDGFASLHMFTATIPYAANC